MDGRLPHKPVAHMILNKPVAHMILNKPVEHVILKSVAYVPLYLSHI